jgi:two-component system OmpR family sensor kinase
MRSLRSRLFAATLAAVLAAVALSLVVGAILVRRSVERSIVSELGRQAELIADLVGVREEGESLRPGRLGAVRRFLRRQGIALAVVSVPLPSRPIGGLVVIPNDAREAIDSGQAVEGRIGVGEQDYLYAARPAGPEAVVLSRPAALGGTVWRPFLGSFLVAGLVGTALAAVASFLLARAIARPVRRVAEASSRLAEGRAPDLVPVEGSDELAQLSVSFNNMAAQLARAKEAEQTFLLSVSHELKTPLTAIRGYGEALGEGAVSGPDGGQVIVQEAVRLERLLQDLLDLARLNQRSFTVHFGPVDLGEVAQEALRRYEPRARGFGVNLVLQDSSPAPAVGDPGRVLQVVSNLLENALRCTPAGGTVTISAAPGTLSVEDSGPGLVPEEVPRAFERFFLYRRYGGERPVGTGLGLAIVKELSDAMGGSVSVSSRPGEGSTFTLRLPIEEAAQAAARVGGAENPSR